MHITRLLTSALAGLIATAPMTITMELLHRQLPQQERYPLPPSELTQLATDQIGVTDELNQQQHKALTLVNHFAYGAVAGAIYAPIAASISMPAVARGMLFGLGVWTISYLGWLPALGILRSATEHPARRSLLMIVAHLVWGSVLGLLDEQWQRRRK